MPSTRSICQDQTFKYNDSLQLLGTMDDSNKEKSFNAPTARSISNQTAKTMSSHFRKDDEQVLTAHELSSETLNYSESSKKGRQRRFAEIPGKFLETHSAEIPSRKVLSDIQQLQRSPSMSEKELKNLKFRSVDVLLEPGKKSFSIISGKGHALPQKRKFGLLPPTPSIISTPKQSSSSRSEENIISQSSTMLERKALFENDKKVSLASKKTSEVIRSRFERFPIQARSVKSGQRKSLGASTKQTRIKRAPSLVTLTQESDDTKSSAERAPSKWFEKSMYIDQSELEPQMKNTTIVIPISSDMSKSSSSNVPVMRQALTSKPNITKKMSSVSSTLTKEKSKQATEIFLLKRIQASRTKGTSIMIQSKDEENLTIQLNINLRVKNKDGKSNEKHILKPERILVKGREVYRKNDGYLL
ncbi:hypothetical protein LOAG_08625 [Loa loa]|uniref:Uncharacterized protein n=1 Tax=Loa loa TaxID=7209 RepID=A0A1S0TTH3_LOALO|nr:hypothetical protein LOAG_08625 [Loa loa]EFO19865.2 hypothetical protein LOAG_08625 [Loa loa]